jgi:hypothetical protein
VPAFTDRGFPINTIQDPGEFADLGPWEFSVDENSSHLHSFFAEGISASTNFQGLGSTYIMPNGANSCRFVFGNGYGPPVPPPWDPPFISNSPFYDTYKSALDNVINKFTQFNAGYAFVEHHVTGFLWVLKLYGPNSGISGSLELFRRHSVQYQMSHVGPTAPSERANTNPTAPWPTGIPANALQYRILPQFRPIDRAGLPDIYLFAPLSMHSMPVLAFSYPVGNRETLAGGRFSYFSFPLFNFDPQLQGLQFLRFLRGAGSFTSPCSKREANVSMLFGDGQSGTVKLRW